MEQASHAPWLYELTREVASCADDISKPIVNFDASGPS